MSSTEPNPTPGKQPRKLTKLFVLKWSLFIVVLFFVGHRARELWNSDELDSVNLQFGWLAAAAAAYIVGWLPSVWFWHRAQAAVGNRARMINTASAYYCGHLGKYIPGKLLVLIIRASMMKRCGCAAGLSIVTAIYETLAMMGVGLAVGVALSPSLASDALWKTLPASLTWVRGYTWLPAVIVVVAGILLLPTVSRIFTWVAVRSARRNNDGNEIGNVQIDKQLLLTGAIAFAFAWVCHGLSLGLTLRGISSSPLDIADWPAWIATISLAVPIGFFVIFAPGGLGPREFVLIEALGSQPSVTGQQAVAVAGLLRLVWLVAEIVSAGTLYYLVRPQTLESPSQGVTD